MKKLLNRTENKKQIFRYWIRQVCEKRKDKVVFSYLKDDQTILSIYYGSLFNYIKSIEENLNHVGVKKTNRVAIIAPNSPYAVIAGTALAYAGCTAVMIDASLPVEEIRRLLEESDVTAAFVDESLREKIGWEYLKKYPIFNLNGSAPFALSDKGLNKTKGSRICDQDEEVIAIIYSSGTTARMKGICITYQSIVDSVSIYQKLTGVKCGDRYLSVLPFNHIAGYSVSLKYILMGCEMDMIENMDSTKLANAFQVFQPHYFAIVPRVYEIMEEKNRSEVRTQGKEKLFEQMLNLSRFFRKKFSVNIGKILFRSVRCQAFGKCMKGIGAGASPCKKETADFFLALGYGWANFYSSTETGVPAVATGVRDQYPDDTVGNVNQFKEIKVKLLDIDKEGIGEIAIRSPLTMKCYFRNPELTDRTKDTEGYVRTGDLGSIDAKGYLHLVGRTKEVIILHNGKKVSPYDVEAIYAQHLKNPVEIACCGITNPRNGYDEIHVFIEQTKNVEQVVSQLRRISEQQGIYRIEQIHVIQRFPKTSIGKIKRNELEKMVEVSAALEEDIDIGTKQSTETVIVQLLCKVLNRKEIPDYTWTLRDDLQMDSLQLFELAVEIEKTFGVNIASHFSVIETIEDIIKMVEKGEVDEQVSDYDINDFPIERDVKMNKRLRRYMKWSHCLWKFDVGGLENIPTTGNYILAPNHESHLDGLWVLSCLQNSNMQYEKFCCMAKQEHLEADFSRKFMNMLGGIPVDRTGNTAKAIHRAIECVNQGYYFLIHPEGTRSRNGKMGEFKEGAALIAYQTGVSIIPVRIEGAREIYPPDRKLPHIFNFRKLQRYRLKITFCKPIEPSADYEAVTRKMREEIAEKL